MLMHRVIPCLLLKNGGLVKSFKFGNPKYVGDPINAIRIFNDKEVDELIVLDIEASKFRREPNYSLIEEFAGECFMPLTYGGGIKTVEQARHLFSIGVEKISIQTGALESLKLISDIAALYGNQSVIVSIDIKRNFFGHIRLYSASSGRTNDLNWLSFMKHAIDAGAGEIMLNAVDRDGTMAGMDISLIRQFAENCGIPLIAVGGVGRIEDIKAAVDNGASAVAAGAFFVFHGPHRAVLITYPKYNDLIALLDKKQ